MNVAVVHREYGSDSMRDLYVFDAHIVARRTVLPLIKPVVFRFHAPEAKLVWLVGKFAADGFKNHEMKRTMDGYWECSVELKRGHYEYHFLVDGVPTPDPHAVGRVPNDLGGFNSVVEVG
jgi:1,4-alpha-glucan branching enzyme